MAPYWTTLPPRCTLEQVSNELQEGNALRGRKVEHVKLLVSLCVRHCADDEESERVVRLLIATWDDRDAAVRKQAIAAVQELGEARVSGVRALMTQHKDTQDASQLLQEVNARLRDELYPQRAELGALAQLLLCSGAVGKLSSAIVARMF